jgi:hypothetical protein
MLRVGRLDGSNFPDQIEAVVRRRPISAKPMGGIDATRDRITLHAPNSGEFAQEANS